MTDINDLTDRVPSDAAIATARLSAIATALYGDQWAPSLSLLSGVHPRTCQRALAAARAGEGFAGAPGLLRAVVERLHVLTRHATAPIN